MQTGTKQEQRIYANSIRYFQELNTPEKNYWFGFLVADGCIQQRNEKDGANRIPYLSIELQERDKNILEQLRKAIGAGYLYFRERLIKGKIGGREIKSGKSVQYRINSQSVFDDLQKHGFEERKTGREKLYLKETSFAWSRLLGFFDGDGCISFKQQTPQSKNLDFYGNINILEEISSFIKEKTGFVGNIYKHGNIFMLEYRTQEAIVTIGQKMFNANKFSLQRKKDVFDILCAEGLTKSQAAKIRNNKYQRWASVPRKNGKWIKSIAVACILFFALVQTGWNWVSSDAIVRLIYPRSYSYEPTADWTEREEPFTWQPYFVAGGVYGIVYNPTQGIDKHQIILKDLTTDETTLVKEVEGHNSNISGILTGGDLVKAKQDVVIGRKYELTLRAWDLNGDSFDDTAIIQIQRR